MTPTFHLHTPVGFAPFDTDDRRAVIRKLTDALYDYLTIELTELEEFSKKQADQQPSGTVPGFTPEMLIEASEGVNALKDRIEKARGGLAKMPDGMNDVFEAAVVGPMEEQLRQAEAWLSKLQAIAEKSDVPG